MRRFLPLIYLLMVAAVFAAGVALWRTYCEGFGCTGLGMAWAMWASFLYAPALVLGLAAKRFASNDAGLRAAVARTLAVQMLAGVCLLVYWAVKTLPGSDG